jgi:uncharacterized protein (DUF2141 family)
MKSNTYMRKLTKAFVMVGALAFPAFALASDDEQTEEPRSAIGVATGLMLFDRDKADTCVPGALQIRATVHNVTKEGIVKLELFGEHKFLKREGKLRRIRVPAEDGSQMICINLPVPGEYAVVGYHDIDGNRRLKKAWNFKPKEPYGLSNNPEIKSMRLPKFSETSIDVPMEGVDIDIHLVDL